ncbi:hypothetical protein KIW84_034874 [Lathyrus oleraceus]|uniref:Squalene monooxygenase n=1 Tax=Pisum sativum TaxID=3888 RepID=A0A9D4Y265_PEA|nr:hypothetical protein KIW84_034874 [Pisum sativum]
MCFVHSRRRSTVNIFGYIGAFRVDGNQRIQGAALAYTLGKDGRRVHVIERDLSEPDRIVGELLQSDGYLKSLELGLEDCVNEIDAQRVFGYALYKDGKNTKLSYPLENFDSDVSGRSFHNGRFIQQMREKASSLPNVKLEQRTVTSLLKENGTIKGVNYKNKSGQEFTTKAPLTIVCDGCFSNLRRSLCNPKVEVPSHFVGLILENCNLPYENHGHVILGDPSPILFYPISSAEIRCLVDVPGQKTLPSVGNGEMANYLKTVVAPQDARINEAIVILDKMVDFDLLTVHNKCTDNSVKNNTTLVAQKIVDSLDKNAIHNSLPNNIVYNITIDGLCKSGKINEARSVLSVLISRGFLLDNFTYCALIHACSASGNMDEAFKETLIEHRDFSINFIKRGWFLMLPPAILISYYCRIGDLDKASKLKEKISQATLASKIEVQHRTSQPSFDSLKALTGSIIEHGKNLEKSFKRTNLLHNINHNNISSKDNR